MKILLAIFCSIALVTITSCSVITVGRNHCTYGPSFWCSNITNAKSCGAVKHCIKTVWEKQHVPEDTDSICQICLDMVKQARDQLESNETMDEIRQVFEGSCNLIPIKVVAKECRKMADDFIPELVEALASQMNPQVVCSTAGLCNNARIDMLLAEYEAEKTKNVLSCSQCNNIGTVISHKFHTSSRDQVLDGFLSACGRLSSFSDACSSIVITHFNEIYNELSKNLKSESICHMSGVCSSKFHQHEPEIEIETKSNVGFIKNKEATDDLPCELCEQLVKHLRDVLIANTTEIEFKTVLEGLCKQTKGFSKECLGLVDQYYDIIYHSLVDNLDANGACFLIGVCPKGNNIPASKPSMPLLPVNQHVPTRKRLGANEKLYTNDQIQSMVLPIDQLMGAKLNNDLVNGGELCPICQYFLHFLQEELSDPKNEDEIKQAVTKTCDRFPNSVKSQCHSFVELYGDAIIALLVQEIDPRDLCPAIKLCPKDMNKDVEVFAIDVKINAENKPTCPLCLLVVKEAQDYIKSSKSKETVKKALEKVCTRLPPKPQLQCTDFVETYYDELLEKLLSDFSPKDICEDLKLCPAVTDDNLINVDSDINTNEIPIETPKKGQFYTELDIEDSGECMLCVEVVGGAEGRISRGMTKQQVEDILLRECSRFRPYEGVCDNFVKKNVDQIIDLLAENLAPKQVCQQLQLCVSNERDLEIDEAIIVNVVAIPVNNNNNNFARVTVSNREPKTEDPVCVLCEFIMTKLESELKDKHTQEEIKQAVLNICNKLPKSINKQCSGFVNQYAELIISLIDTVPPKEICVQMSLCLPQKKKMTLVGDSECTWGPSHFCSQRKIAEKCKATDYCLKRKLGAFV